MSGSKDGSKDGSKVVPSVPGVLYAIFYDVSSYIILF